MKHSKYFFADKGYCSTKIRDKTKNILSIISFNRRNTKDKNKITKLKFTKWTDIFINFIITITTTRMKKTTK
jgi:hypothetical protein